LQQIQLLLYDLEHGYWISNTPISASYLYGTASWAEGLTGSLKQDLYITGSVNISGSLLLNGSPVGGGTATVVVSGSQPSGSNPSGSLWYNPTNNGLYIQATTPTGSNYTLINQPPVTISGSAPSGAFSGSLWWNNNDGNLYIQVVTPTGSTYVPATNTVAGGNYGATFTSTNTGSVWTIIHNLDTTTPLVTVYSGSSVMIPASITSTNANTTVITFSGSVTGTAILSTGIGNETTDNAVSASYASSIGQLNQSLVVTGSTTFIGNLSVLGTASFTYLTASSTLVNQNSITVFGSGSALTTAGYRAVDTASVNNSGSLLYNFSTRGWESSAPITASFFQGTASFATSASIASTASSITPLNQNVLITGSLTVITGSNIELRVTDTGVTLGNVSTDRHTITGSLNVTGSITGSLFGTASFATSASQAISASMLVGSQATYLYTQKTATQTIAGTSVAALTTWGSPVISINAGEWNGTTGVFTATKAGLYEVSAVLQMGNETYAFAGGEIGLLILINGSSIGVGRWFVPTASYSGLPPSIYASALVNLSVGNTVSAAVSNFSGASRTTFTNGTFITIKELPTRIQR
jgi:hypothetical protein